MRRKFLSVVLCVCMMLTMAPFAFAEEGNTGSSSSNDGGSAVAKVGETPYNTLQEAINNATDDATITLLRNVSFSSEVTLDLSGKTINTDGNTISVNSGTLTVTGNGTIQNDRTGVEDNEHALFHVNSGATLNITNGTFKSASCQLLEVAGTCNIDTASFECTTENNTYDSHSMIVVYGENALLNFKSGSVTMKGSTVPSDGMYGIYASKGGSVTLGDSETKEGPTITSHFAALGINHETSPSTWNIYGGTYTSTAKASTEWWKYFCGAMYLAGNCEVNIYDGTFNGGNYTLSMPWADADVKLTINGGTFNETDGDGILYFRKNTATETTTSPSATINSGTFNGTLVCGDKDVKDVVVTGGTFNPDCNSTYKAVAIVDGKAYTSLASAIAVADGKTVQLISNTTENVTIPSGKSITLDLNGHKIVNSSTAQDKNVADNLRKHTITNNGTLTIMDSVGTGVVDNVSHGRAALYNAGTISEIKGGKFTRSVDNSTDASSAKGNSYYVVENKEGATITAISAGDFLAVGKFSSLFRNGGTIGEISGGTFTQDGFIAFKNEGTVNKISGGTFSSKDESCIQNWGTIGEICGGAITAGSIGIWNFSSDKYSSAGKVTNISGGEIKGTTAAIRLNDYDATYLNPTKPSSTNRASATISGGKINGVLQVNANTTLTITGGYFTTDPTAYLANGKGLVDSDLAGYYKVGNSTVDVDTEVKAGAPSVSIPTDSGLTEDDVKNAATSQATQASLAKAASSLTSDQSIVGTKEEAKAKLGSIAGNDSTITVVVQPYLDVKVTEVNNNAATMSVNISAQYNIIATTDPNNIKLPKEGENNANAVILKEKQDMSVSKPVTIKLPLPSNFDTAGDKLSIKHTKGNGSIEYYTGTVTTDKNNNKFVTFTTNGFSPFVIYAASANVASIGDGENEQVFTSFQAAVDAVENGGTIKALKNIDSTVSGNKSFKVNANDKTVKLTAASGYNLTKDATGKYTVFRQSSGGPGSSGGSISAPTTYNVNVNAATNGAVAADKKTASKGTTVTVTASPSKGYVVDAVKVVDKDGKDVAVTEKDGKYVFTMPASAVTVTGSFKAETPAPVALPFTDVKSGNWFYDAVKYAYEQGLMTGTSATTFAPNGTMNRAMIVTVLYRLEKSPAVTGASKFTDVPAGQWYSDAVAWAAANKIVNGYDETTFGPMNAVTREQMAAILFRYEQVKGLENVTLEENLNRFPDQNKISAYAIPALQWAVGQKIINGNADGTLDPTGTATRAQVAQIFTNLLNK